MNKSELIHAVAGKSGFSRKDVDTVLESFLEVVEETLKSGSKIQLIGFGSFEVKLREARIGRNPKTKEPIEIPATKVPVFRAGKTLKDAVSGQD